VTVLNLIKLCVGCDSVDELVDWWRQSHAEGERWKLRTRQTPRRAAELVDGGSLYRVFKGFILCRQRIWAVKTTGEGAARRCELTLDPAIVLTEPAPRRAFQGWRYLEAKDAPPDLSSALAGQTVPVELARRLREIGAW